MNLEWGQGLLQNLVSAPVGQIILLFFAFGIGQIVIPPFPGDILLLLAGGLWPQGFAQDAWFLLLPYWFGTTLASFGAYELGARFGMRIFTWKWVRRFFPEESQHAVTQWLNSSGVITVFCAKFITGMNVPILIISGAMGLERQKSYPVISLTTAVQNTLFFTIGTALGGNWALIQSLFSRYRIVFLLAMVLLIGLMALFSRLVARRITGKKNS